MSVRILHNSHLGFACRRRVLRRIRYSTGPMVHDAVFAPLDHRRYVDRSRVSCLLTIFWCCSGLLENPLYWGSAIVNINSTRMRPSLMYCYYITVYINSSVVLCSMNTCTNANDNHCSSQEASVGDRFVHLTLSIFHCLYNQPLHPTLHHPNIHLHPPLLRPLFSSRQTRCLAPPLVPSLSVPVCSLLRCAIYLLA